MIWLFGLSLLLHFVLFFLTSEQLQCLISSPAPVAHYALQLLRQQLLSHQNDANTASSRVSSYLMASPFRNHYAHHWLRTMEPHNSKVPPASLGDMGVLCQIAVSSSAVTDSWWEAGTVSFLQVPSGVSLNVIIWRWPLVPCPLFTKVTGPHAWPNASCL